MSDEFYPANICIINTVKNPLITVYNRIVNHNKKNRGLTSADESESGDLKQRKKNIPNKKQVDNWATVV